MEFLTGAGLAVSAGLNAYIPLLLLGLTARFTDIVSLPAGWAWLENGWVLLVLGVLLVIEFFADKIPGLDSVNDIVHTVVRPAAGGLAFGSGSTASTVAVTDPAAFFSSNQWVPIVVGAVIALAVHLAKMTARPVINVATLGVGAPVASAIEDAGSIVVSVLAIVVPILAMLAIAVGIFFVVRLVRRFRRRARPATDASSPPSPGSMPQPPRSA
ncbi:DUF4126 domain-containing protein [Glaciibacter superstes]|uniref:DUF4126 domain-containing protein n=1 Tax=Glaciibacter superstes TaxID=501023 RepID=UPI0003B34E21|nr:DUF4126 domain-containing protein [Glaciibacter superstes]